ncbi:MAG: anion transporter [Halobacteria archaeon]
MTWLPVVVLLAVFLLIAARQVGRVRLRIWHIMLGGAAAVLLTGQIGPAEAAAAVNPDVMLFLFGMFVVGRALEESGYLYHLGERWFGRTRSADGLLLLVFLWMGLLSAFLLNDTLAIIGTPLVLNLARKHGLPPKMLLLALAFAVTIGSVASPIGNPQNLLVALDGGVPSPFVTFGRFLLLPTLVNLVAAYLLLRFAFRDRMPRGPLEHRPEPVKDPALARLCQIALALVVAGVAARISISLLGLPAEFRLTCIALAGAAPILLLSPKRADIARRIDWPTLVFFVAMFVLMQSVWDTGFFQSLLTLTGADVASLPMILLVSVVLSQFISNVPLVALYLPLLVHGGASTEGLMALAAGSTVAGNLTILGAASNVIIIQNAERQGETLTFREFTRFGVPLTALNLFVYWLFLR